MDPIPAVIDLGVSSLPHWLFAIVHLAGIGIGAVLARRAYGHGIPLIGHALVLYAVAEVVYLGYHAGITTFLLSHTIAEVLVLVAFVLAATGGVQLATGKGAARARS